MKDLHDFQEGPKPSGNKGGGLGHELDQKKKICGAADDGGEIPEKAEVKRENIPWD